MVWRDGELSRELRQRALWVGGECLTRSGDERTTRLRGCGTSRADGTWIALLERVSGKCDCTLDEFVGILATACCCEQQPVCEVDLGRSSKRLSRQRRLSALE